MVFKNELFESSEIGGIANRFGLFANFLHELGDCNISAFVCLDYRLRVVHLLLKHLVLARQGRIRWITLAEDRQDLDCFREALRGYQTVRELVVRVKFIWLHLKRDVCIRKCLIVLHKALPDACSLQQELVVKSVIVC